jgi:hypothetical protein
VTHKYKIESKRLFRGHPISTHKPVEIEIGEKTHLRTLISNAKKALGWDGVKTTSKDLGDVILLKPQGNPNLQLSITFCS